QQLNTDNHRLIGNLEVLQQLIFKNDLAEVYPDGEFKIDSDIEDKAALISKSAKKFFSTNFSANSAKKEENSDKKLFHQQLDSIIAELKKLREVNEEYKDQAAYSVDKISSLKAKIEKYKVEKFAVFLNVLNYLFLFQYIQTPSLQSLGSILEHHKFEL
ncbi:MAG: hypothetical protein MHPSP_004390, partial [Paramarteilia canceri]